MSSTHKLALVLYFALLSGCQAAINGSLVTLSSLATARGDGVAMLMKIDTVKQLQFRAKAKLTKTNAEQDALEQEFNDYTQKRDKALLTFEKMGNALHAAKETVRAISSGKAGKLDLMALFAIYGEVKTLAAELGVNLPEVK